MSTAGQAGMAGYYTEAFTETELVTHEFPLIDDPCVIAAGQVLERGAVLGRVTASKKLVLSLAAANDGSQVPYGILPFDVEAAVEDKNAAVYVAGGRFVTGALILGAGHTIASVKTAFEGKPIFFVDVV
jgi:hypothetical protein